MHVVISQEPLYTEIYRKNAAPKREHPDEAPTFTTTIRTPQCGHTVCEKLYNTHFGPQPLEFQRCLLVNGWRRQRKQAFNTNQCI